MQNPQTAAVPSQVEQAPIQAQAPIQMQAPNQSPAPAQSSSGLLLVGVVFLLGLVTGVSIPVAMKFIGATTKKTEAKVAASSPDSESEDETVSEDETKSVPNTKSSGDESRPVQKSKLADEAKAIPKPKAKAADDTKSALKKSADESKAASKAKAAALAPKKANSAKTLAAKTPVAAPAKTNPTVTLEEIPTSIAMVSPAPAAAAAVPAPAPRTGSTNAGAPFDVNAGGSAASKTIALNSYSKDSLRNCPKYCVLHGKDKSGSAVSAVINGREFADVLNQHQGSVELVGKQQKVKGQSIFMVQSINLTLESK